MLEAVHRISGQVLRAIRPDSFPEPRDRAGPSDPLGDHRRRHRRIGRQQRPDARLHLADRRRRRSPLILRRTIIGQRTGHRVTRDAQLPCDSPLGQPFAEVKMQDQGPVFQGDHPSNLIGWPTFQPVATGRVLNRCQQAAGGRTSRCQQPTTTNRIAAAAVATAASTSRQGHPDPWGLATSDPAATAIPRNQTRITSSRDPARRSRPRTVGAGIPRLAAIRRCPTPTARVVTAAQIHSAA